MGSSEPSDLNCSVENESPARMRKSLCLFFCCFTGAEEGERGELAQRQVAFFLFSRHCLWFGISKCFIGTRQNACVKFAVRTVRLEVEKLHSSQICVAKGRAFSPALTHQQCISLFQ